jgi:hypothetical protein
MHLTSIGRRSDRLLIVVEHLVGRRRDFLVSRCGTGVSSRQLALQVHSLVAPGNGCTYIYWYDRVLFFFVLR